LFRIDRIRFLNLVLARLLMNPAAGTETEKSGDMALVKAIGLSTAIDRLMASEAR
jgi:hypothetical protein